MVTKKQIVVPVTLTQASLADGHGLVSPDVRRHEEHGAFGEHGRAQHHAEGEQVDEQLEELESDGHRATHHRLVLVTRRRHHEHVPSGNVVPSAGKTSKYSSSDVKYTQKQ